MKKSSWIACGTLFLGGLASGACGSSGDDGGSGGTESGGAGGTSAGGKSSGGASTGGKSSGGASVGGVTSTGGMGGGGAPGSGGGGGDPGCDVDELVSMPHGTCAEIDIDAIEGDVPTATGFSISSPDFESCTPIPDSATCDGREFAKGSSPKLEWTGKPTGTMSYAIVFKDISILSDMDPATERFGQHWAIWDIPADVTELAADLATGHLPSAPAGARQWASRNNYGFFGPCPNPFPAGDERFACSLTLDSYAFVIYALDVETIADDELPEPEEGVGNYVVTMDKFLRESGHAIAYAAYKGTSDAWSTAFNPPDPAEFPCTDTLTTECLAGP